MKVILTADWHIGYPNKTKDVIWAVNGIRDYAVKHGIDTWFVLGDMMHDRELVDISDLCSISDFLVETTTKFNHQIFTFPGNHDMYLKNSWSINSIKVFSGIINVINGVQSIVIGGRRIFIVPFIHYESEYMRVIAELEKSYKDGDLLFTHIGVKNSSLNSCFMSKSWSVVDFSGSKFRHIFTGHFHIPQKVGDNVWYVGSPIPFRVDEGDCDHGFMVLDLATLESKFIDLWEVAANPPPKFITIDLENLPNVDKSVISNNHIRIMSSSQVTSNQLDGIKSSLATMGAVSVNWSEALLRDNCDRIMIANDKISSINDLFKMAVEAEIDDAGDLKREKIFRLNESIIDEGDSKYAYTRHNDG